jgi:thiosulfate dehydrogenase (quinone) large subunit
MTSASEALIFITERAAVSLNKFDRERSAREAAMASGSQQNSALENTLIVFFRLCIGWTFLWAGIHHFGDSQFVPGFLSHTKTFSDVYAPMAASPYVPLLTFLVEYGHLAIGLSLISGLLVRVSASFAILLLLLYWTAHMDFPYIENVNSLLIDYHIVYAGLCVYLIMKNAGHVFGLDAWAANLPIVRGHPVLAWQVG